MKLLQRLSVQPARNDPPVTYNLLVTLLQAVLKLLHQLVIQAKEFKTEAQDHSSDRTYSSL